MDKFQNFSYSFADLLKDETLPLLDNEFQAFLPESLCQRLHHCRQSLPSKKEQSAAILALAPYLEKFCIHKFDIQKESLWFSQRAETAKVIHEAQVRFVRRYVAKTYAKHECIDVEESYWFDHFYFKNNSGDEVIIAQKCLDALDDHSRTQEKEVLAQFIVWCLYHKNAQKFRDQWALLQIPQAVDPENLLTLMPRKNNGLETYTDPQAVARSNFSLWDHRPSSEKIYEHGLYCLYCHDREKDSCSVGFDQKNTDSQDRQGCPLEQKISEMNSIYSEGFPVGALAIIMIDNPMAVATGHRICNDCKRSCIFQKQTPVDVPNIESQIVRDVLSLPFGFEIYALLSRWNPLNFSHPFPHIKNEKTVLIVGQGPAGFGLAHLLLNQGVSVVAIDGQTCSALNKILLQEPIQNVEDVFEDLHQRKAQGFGGVAEFGITTRWEKNYLTLIRILLHRRSHYRFFHSMRWGSQITFEDACSIGFDHVALCMGIGSPKTLEQKNHLAGGVRIASDFLMHLNLTSPYSLKSCHPTLSIELPVIVVGGGLTAIDAATEALAYYPLQVKNFTKQFHELPPDQQQKILQSPAGALAQTFLNHAQEIISAEELQKPILPLLQAWGGVKIIYRNKIQSSPAYIHAHEEIEYALNVGVEFLENCKTQEICVDQEGYLASLKVSQNGADHSLPAKTLLTATGFYSQTCDQNDLQISLWGDMLPKYRGSVVKALASVKKGLPNLMVQLRSQKSLSNWGSIAQKCEELWQPEIIHNNVVGSSHIFLSIRAPVAAKKYQSGQYYRVQKPGQDPLVLFPFFVDKEKGIISFLILQQWRSSWLKSFEPGNNIGLMGPVGQPLPNEEHMKIITDCAFVGSALCIEKHLPNAVVLIQDSLDQLNRSLYELIKNHYPEFDKPKDSHKSFTKSVLLKKNASETADFHLVLTPLQCAMGGMCGRCLININDGNTEKGFFVCTNLWHNSEIIESSAIKVRKEQKNPWNELWKYLP